MFECNYNKYKRKESKTQNEINFSDKWEQLDSIFNKKKKRINFFDEFDTRDESEIDAIADNKTNMNTNTLSIKDNFNLNKLIHPIDDEFDKYIKEKIDVLDKIKYNKYKQKNEQLNNIKEYNTINNFNLTINKYKKNNISLIKGKNEPLFILNKNMNINYKDEINKMKTKKYFFSETIEADNTYIGKRNKMRLNKLLNKIKKENINTEIINIPNKFDILNKEENKDKDYFDLLLEQINIKKNKIK